MNKKKRRLSLRSRRMIMGYLFILPWFVGFLIFYVRSIILTGQFSFSKLTPIPNVGGYTIESVGLQNYIYAFREHGSFKQILTTSVMNMLIDVPLITFFSLFMAMLLNKKFPGRAFFRAIFFLPVILNSGAISAMMDLAETMMNGGISTTSAEVSAKAGTELAFSIDYLLNMFMNFGIPAKVIDYLAGAVSILDTVVLEDNRAYPFTLNASFRNPCVFRYEVDRKNSVENYYTNGDAVTMTANNKTRVWISNGNTVKFQVIAGGRSHDLEIAKAGEVVVEDIKWIRTDDGRYRLVVEALD